MHNKGKKLKNLNRTFGFLFYKKNLKNLNSDILGFLGMSFSPDFLQLHSLQPTKPRLKNNSKEQKKHSDGSCLRDCPLCLQLKRVRYTNLDLERYKSIYRTTGYTQTFTECTLLYPPSRKGGGVHVPPVPPCSAAHADGMLRAGTAVGKSPHTSPTGHAHIVLNTR